MVVFVGINNEGKVENIVIGDNDDPNIGKNAELPEFTSQLPALQCKIIFLIK